MSGGYTYLHANPKHARRRKALYELFVASNNHTQHQHNPGLFQAEHLNRTVPHQHINGNHQCLGTASSAPGPLPHPPRTQILSPQHPLRQLMPHASPTPAPPLSYILFQTTLSDKAIPPISLKPSQTRSAFPHHPVHSHQPSPSHQSLTSHGQINPKTFLHIPPTASTPTTKLSTTQVHLPHHLPALSK